MKRADLAHMCPTWLKKGKGAFALLAALLLSSCADQSNVTQPNTVPASAPRVASQQPSVAPELVLPEVSEVAQLLRRRISDHLYLPESYIGLQAMVEIRINRDTQLTFFKIVNSSGNVDFDNRVKLAVFKSFPIPAVAPLPKLAYQQLKEIHLKIAPEKAPSQEGLKPVGTTK
ncbi:cell envelope integrity protein TolA [Vibrio profundum]|uniref:cell envelope integrity protein TolA n=1 Tax=Vibrio profundum TaxID=2910247 RepID=UPI003D1302A1